MKYMGSKNRIAKYILPIMLKDRKPCQYWVEPFVGGANMIDKVEGPRIGADINPYLIEALKLIKNNPQSIPDLITETDYQKAKTELKKDGLTGFIGFALSFGGKWFGGYRRDVKGSKGCIENMKTQSRRAKENALAQSPKLKGVDFIAKGYSELTLVAKSIIYCDPPYQGTTKYKDDFNHAAFWEWCREKTTEGHTVFISEYSAPDDFLAVWSMEVSTTLNKSKKDVEKLFVYEPLLK